MESHRLLLSCLSMLLLAGCAVSIPTTPLVTSSATPSQTTSPSLSPTITPISISTPTLTYTLEPLSSKKPQTLIFYGDSLLKVGDVNEPGEVGFSIADVLRQNLNPADQILLENYGGRNAKWGYENLKTYILDANPDIVTLWWGMNDLGGCPGIFDRATNSLLQYELDAMLNQHLMYMTFQIRDLVAAGIPVIVMTPMPVRGELPWSHFDENNMLVWENDYYCDFNLGLDQLVQAQRSMVAGFVAKQAPVYLVDTWNIYKDHPNSDKMYMDTVHPGSYGVELIARDWMKIFQSINQ